MLFGGSSNDTIFGGPGADTLVGGFRHDTLDGGPGEDAASYYNAIGPVVVNLSTGSSAGALGSDSLASIEVIVGGLGGDTLTGDSLDNWIEGRSSDDLISGAAGDDVLFGNGGADSMLGGPGDDYLDGMFGIDALDGGSDTDICIEQSGTTVGCELFPDAVAQDPAPAPLQPSMWGAGLPELWWRALPDGR